MAKSILILTGAGISAESGLDTFRSSGGLWEQHRIEDVATPEAFARNAALVQNFYNKRRTQLFDVAPNAAHKALARLERDYDGELLIITQNVDDLHERGGSKNVLHMHGKLRSALCTNCGNRDPWLGDINLSTTCGACSRAGVMRPDIVWFGEEPYHMERVWEALASCDLFVSIGTSGNVYPAAQFVQQAKRAGAHTLELNLEPSSGASDFDEALYGRASHIVPKWVEEQLMLITTSI